MFAAMKSMITLFLLVKCHFSTCFMVNPQGFSLFLLVFFAFHSESRESSWAFSMARWLLHQAITLLGSSEALRFDRLHGATSDVTFQHHDPEFGSPFPDAPWCWYIYLHLGDFGQGQMLVNIPYMEHMGFNTYTLWLFNIAMENGWEMDEHGPFIDDKHGDSPNLKMKKNRSLRWITRG